MLSVQEQNHDYLVTLQKFADTKNTKSLILSHGKLGQVLELYLVLCLHQCLFAEKILFLWKLNAKSKHFEVLH